MSLARARGPHAATLGAAALVLAWRASAGAHAFDTGELVGAAFVLGPSHPPGQPLHSILGYIATLVPLGGAAFRVSLVSVASTLGAAWLAGRATSELLDALGALSTRFARFAADAVAVALLLSPPLLRQATRPEVYASALALYALALLALLRFARGDGRGLFVSALAAGLASGLHPPHALAAAVVGLGFALVARRDTFKRWRALSYATLAFVAGASVHALLPARAIAGAPSWGEPTTWDGFIAYVSARAYQQNLGAGGGGVGADALELLRYVPLSAGVVPLFGLIAVARGARTVGATDRGLVMGALAAVPLALVAAFVRPVDEIVPDAVAYAAPAVLTLIVVGGAGIGVLLASSSEKTLHRVFAMALLVLLAANVTSLPRAAEALDADSPALDALALGFVETPKTRSLVVVTTDFPASAFVMERDVADARPDLAILPSGLASSSFTWRELAKHPVFTVGPVRGPGRDAWERFTRGAMGLADGRVPIAAEDGFWLAHASGIALSGPYLVTDDAHGEVGIVERSAGERLAPEIGRLSPRDRGGDHDVTGAIVRHYALARAGRLAAIGRADAALAELRRALWFLPEEERALVVHRSAGSGSRAARPVVVVRDRGVFLASRGDAVRSAAVLLDATGEASRADALLEAQEARGDVRARLERAWLAGARGDRETARALAESALAESPDLAPDVEALLRSLRP